MASRLFLMTKPAPFESGTPAIAVWANPDGETVSGTIKVGVVAYHETGINRVEFNVDGGSTTSVYTETANTDHTDWDGNSEYEFVYTIDTTLLSNGSRTVNARAYPNTGTSRILPAFTINVQNGTSYDTWYVDSVAGDDDTGDGSTGTPWETLDKACTSCSSGDTIKCKAGTYALPTGSYGFTEYVTIEPDGAASVTINGGEVGTNFLKIQGVTLGNNTGIYSSSKNHIWIKDCTGTGYGYYWYDNWESTTTYRWISFTGTSGHITVENCTGSDHTSGIACIGSAGRAVIRGCTYNQPQSDSFKYQGDDVLITGCRATGKARPGAWSVAKNAGSYAFGAGQDIHFYISTNKGSSYDVDFTVNLSGTLSAADTASALNADGTFSTYFTASVSASPYPNTGNLFIQKTDRNNENDYWYATDTAAATLDLSDNDMALNDISVGDPSKCLEAHLDHIANDAGLASLQHSFCVIRNSRFIDGGQQGIKWDSYPVASNDTTHTNVATINCVIDTIGAIPARLHNPGSGGNTITHEHFLIEHCTIWKPLGIVNTAWVIEANDTNSDCFFRNNIVGIYCTGDNAYEVSGVTSDYNLFYDGPATEVLNTNSAKDTDLGLGDTANNDFTVEVGSPAIGMATTVSGIAYDISWTARANDTVGAYEYTA